MTIGNKLKKGSLDDHQNLKHFTITVVSRELTHSALRNMVNLIVIYVSYLDSHQRYLKHLHSYQIQYYKAIAKPFDTVYKGDSQTI